LSQLFPLFLNNLLPILLVAAAGFLLSKFTALDPSSLSKIIFYILGPCLVFTLLTQNELSDGDFLRITLFSAISILFIGLLAWIIGKSIGLGKSMLASFLITCMFMNSGNYGLSVVLFAFGNTSLKYASLFFVVSAVLAYSLGVIIASLGSTSFKKAILNLLKIPMVYALVLAIFYNRTTWEIPVPIYRSIEILSQASIPTMIILLGLQLRTAQWKQYSKPLILASMIRLIIAPLVTFLISPLFGILSFARQAVVIQSAMPSAVLTTVLATEYDTEPSFVTSVVFVTTILSPLTLTPLLAVMGA